MKAIIIADLHAHLYKEFAKSDPYLVNSRLRNLDDLLIWLKNKCEESNIHNFIIAGDVFHSRSSVPSPVLSTVFESLSSFKSINVYMIPGNHDQWDYNFTSLDTFSSIAYVYKSFVIKEIEGTTVAFLPYRENEQEWMQQIYPEVDLVIAHLGISGANVGNHLYQDSYLTTDILQKSFPNAQMLFGHFHIHQHLTENISYIGAVIQHSFSDASFTPYFAVYDEGNIEYIENDISPRFIKIDLTEDNITELKLDFNNYYWISSDIPDKLLRKELENMGLDISHFRLQQKHKKSQVVKRALDDQKMGYEDMIRKYVVENNNQLPVTEEVIDYGIKTLNKVKERNDI